jgi:hypothetical protein
MYKVKPGERLIHTRVSEKDHERIRVAAAHADLTVQDWAERVMLAALDKPEKRKGGEAVKAKPKKKR